MAKVNWETATPAQAAKMNELIGENQAWAKANQDKVAAANGKDDEKGGKKDRKKDRKKGW